MEKLTEKNLEENYHNALKTVRELLEDYASHLSVGEHAEHRKRCIDGVVNHYLQAVELGREMNLKYFDKQVFYHFRNFLENLDFSPDLAWILERDTKEILQRVGEKEKTNLSFAGKKKEGKKYEEAIDACHVLLGIFRVMKGIRVSAELKTLLNQNLEFLREIKDLYYRKRENPGLMIDPQLLLNSVAELKKIAQHDDFWEAFDVLISKNEPTIYDDEVIQPFDLKSKQEMVKLLEGYMNFFNHLALESYPTTRKIRH